MESDAQKSGNAASNRDSGMAEQTVPELIWHLGEPTEQEKAFMREQEAFYHELLTAFALTLEEIGAVQDTNKSLNPCR